MKIMTSVIVLTGEVLGFESLVYGVFEFVHVLIDTSKFRTTVKSSVNDILYYVILYMQMTDDQVWKENNFYYIMLSVWSCYMRVSLCIRSQYFSGLSTDDLSEMLGLSP